MLDIEIGAKLKEIKAHARDIDIVLDEDSPEAVFELPPPNVLLAGERNMPAKITFSETVQDDVFDFQGIIHREYLSLLQKQEKFQNSKTFALKFADLAAKSGELEAAERVLSNFAKRTPDKAVMHKLGDVLIQRGKVEHASRVFYECELHSDIHSNLKLAFIFTTRGDISSAARFLAKAHDIDPSDPKTHMFLGAMNLHIGHYEQAIRNFRTASASKKDSSALHVNLAASHLILGFTEKATKELRKALALNPFSENALIFYADLLAETKQWEKSIPELENFIRVNQASKLVWERLGRAYYYTKNFQLARDAVQVQLSISNDSGGLNNLGLIYWQLGKAKEGLKCLYEAYTMVESDIKLASVPLLNIILVLNEQRRYKDSIGILKKFLSPKRTNIENRVFLKLVVEYFVALEAIGEFEAAAAELNKYIDLPFSDVEGRVLLLSCKIHADTSIVKDFQSGERCFYELIKVLDKHEKVLEPDTIRVTYNNIIFFSLSKGDIESARSFLNKISKYVSKDPYCTATYGLYHLKVGSIQTALELYRKAISIAKQHDLKDKVRQRMNYEIGKYYLQSGDAKAAARYLTRVLKEKKGYPYVSHEASDLLKRLQ